MRRFIILALLTLAPFVRAGEGSVVKVLPQLLDKKGQNSLSPSLYERDAYQFYLRNHPAQRAALSLAVEWKARDVDWTKLTLRAEMRGLTNSAIKTITIEKPVQRTGHFGNWSQLKIDGPEFQSFGQLVAWRVSLWEAGHELGEMRSFLWSGVGATP
jgi:hypothetical protein